MDFEYILEDAGWADAIISNSRGKAEMTVSYLHDSLGDLTKLLLAFVRGETREGSVVFMDEPGECEMVLKRTENDAMTVEVRWFDDWASWDMHPKSKFKVLFTDQVDFWEGFSVLKRAVDRVYNEFGSKKYKEMWIEHDFPESEVLELRRLANT